jgi:hypothetical protein
MRPRHQTLAELRKDVVAAVLMLAVRHKENSNAFR